MTKVVLIRHGESVWNKENLFTGWADVTLSEKGIKTNSATFMAAEAVEGVTLTGETGILFGSVNSVMNGDKSVDQWYQESVDAVAKIAEANAKADK